MDSETTDMENEDASISKAMKDIFMACDADGSNKVQVCKLIDFIKPFMPDNISELLELQAALDPENMNPHIDCAFFYSIMTEWAKKVNEEVSNSKDNDFLNMTPNLDLGKFDENLFVPFVQSTPRSSFGNRFLRGYVELNKSLQTSFLDNTQGGGLDKTYYEDQINELVHQNRKNCDELSRVKVQLVNAEEQNEILQTELKKVNKLLSHEHEVNENLQKERTNCDDLRDASVNAKQQLDKISKQLSIIEKENSILKQQIVYLEKEKLQCEEKNVRIHAKLDETKKMLIELETEQNFREKELVQLEQMNMDLVKDLEDHKKLIDDFKDTIECLRVEKDKMERMLHEKMKNSSRRQSQSFSEYKNTSVLYLQKSPHASFSQQSNSSAIHVPFSPAVTTDRFDFFNIDSPYARRKCHSVILDRSVPGEVKEIQTLTPTQVTKNTKKNTCKDVMLYKSILMPKGDDEGVDSPPPIFVIGRTPPNKNNDSSSEEEYLLKMQTTATNIQSSQQSLHSELSQFKDQMMIDPNKKPDDLDSLQIQEELNNQQKNELLITLLQADSEKMKKQAKDDQIKIDELLNEKTNLKSKLNEFQEIDEKWREMVDNYNKILEEKGTLQVANETNSQKIKSLTTDLCNIQKENIASYNVLVKDHEQLQIEIAQLRDYKNNTESQLKEFEIENLKISKQLTLHSDMCNDSKSELALLEDVHSKLEKDYAKIKNRYESLLLQFNEDATLYQENVNRLEKLNCEKVREIEELKREAEMKSRKFKNEIQEANMKLDGLHNENNNCIILLNESDSTKKKLEENIRILELKNNNLEDLLCNSIEEKDEYVKKLGDVSKQIEKSKRDVDILECEFLKHCHNMTFLVNENTSLRIELSDVSTDRLKVLEHLSSCSRELKEIISTRSYKCFNCRNEPNVMTNYDCILSQYLDSQKCVLEYHKTNYESEIQALNDNVLAKDRQILKLQEVLDAKERELVQSKDRLCCDDIRPQYPKNVDNKRNKHDRLQYKLEKLEERAIYFQELLEKEKEDKDKTVNELKIQLANIIRENELKVKKETSSLNVMIFENRHRLRRSIFNFVKRWRSVLESIPAMDDVLDKIDNDEPLLPDRNYERVIDKELFLLKTEVQLIINLLERLGDTDFMELVNLLENKIVLSFPVTSNSIKSTFMLKPPTLLVRPVSPDSPSMEHEMSNDAVGNSTLTAINCKPDNSNDSRQFSPDSAGGQSIDILSTASVSIEEINSSDDHEVNRTIYEDAEAGDRPMFVLNGTGQSFENFERENLSDSELEEKFTTFVLEFTMDSNTIKQRCEKQSTELNRSEVEMTTLFQDFTRFLQMHLKEESLKQAERKVETLLVDGLRLARSAEQLGGLKQEHRMLKAINLMINYVSSLRKRLDVVTQKLQRCTNLHRELVSVSDIRAIPTYSSRSLMHVFRLGRTLGVVSIWCAGLCIVLALLFIGSEILWTQSNDVISAMTIGDIMELFLTREYSDEPPPS